MDPLSSIAQSCRKESVVNHLGSGEIELAGKQHIPIHCPFHLHSISWKWNTLQVIKNSWWNNTNIACILCKFKRTFFLYPVCLSRVQQIYFYKQSLFIRVLSERCQPRVCLSGSCPSSHWRPKPELNTRFNLAGGWNISCNLSNGRAKQPHQPAFKNLPWLILYELLALSKGDDTCRGEELSEN